MKNLLLTICLLLLATSIWAQEEKVTLKGVVKDAVSQETLISATVRAGEAGTVTNVDGYYELELAPGEYQIVASYVGYVNDTSTITLSDGTVNLNFTLSESSILMEELEITADVARSRETPVAFSTVPLEKIQGEIGMQDLPQVLNSTPGVYATQQGGGDGDARITIRGFSQRNVAVLIDGVPVNDMENGWVYWSNWSGLQSVARSMQVQRGLGASKLALPSVGGTINLLTKGIESKRRFSVKQTIGTAGFSQTRIAGSTGRLPSGWGLTFTGSYRRGNGWVDQTWTKAWFYFAKLERSWGKHTIGLSVVGAPQSHGQRSFKQRIAVFDKGFAANMFEGSDALYRLMTQRSQNDISQEQYEGELAALGLSEEAIRQAQYTFVDTAVVTRGDYGIRYNPHWGNLQRNGDSEAMALNSRENIYHKPQFTLRDFWTVNNQLSISNVAYLSVGRGGGVASSGSGFGIMSDGQLDIQSVYNSNQSNPITGCAPCATANILRRSVNSHFWYGLLSTFDYEINPYWNLSGGIDLRSYRGFHYRTVEDLLGGAYFGSETNQKMVGDTIDYNYDGLVKWGGLFAQAEYKNDIISAFFNVSGALSNYKMITYLPTDSTFAAVNIPGFTAKTGLNWNFTDRMNVFFNTGYLNKAPGFNNVFDSRSSAQYDNFVNEEIIAVELGYGFANSRFALNANAYNTVWLNKPLTTTVPSPTNEEERVPANVSGLKAIHRGVELDFAYEIVPKKIKWEGLASVGDWTWQTDSASLSVEGQDIAFSANGVHVGDAAQLQFGSSLRFEPFKGANITFKGTYFGKNFADFSPDRLTGMNADRESWQLPSYTLFDIHAGYRFKLGEKLRAKWGASLLNVTDLNYISDASTRSGFDLDQVEVFFGTGRRWSTYLQLTF